MLSEITIPRISDKPLSVPLEAGRPLFVVGANGSGKSALIQHLVSSNLPGMQVVRIPAHRQTWLPSGLVDITPHKRHEMYEYHRQLEQQLSSRWSDAAAKGKQSVTLYDLMAKENERARRITRHFENHDNEAARKMAVQEISPFARINELLACGALAVSLERPESEEILVRHEPSGDKFSIAQMSDGERSAVMLAAQILTVKEGTVLLIDEPERHLHRSIIEPFLSALFAQREDCAFVISTHEIALPISNPDACVLIVRSCVWSDKTPTGWDIQLLQGSEESGELPENIKRAILGARKRVLFVEGSPDGLDQALYRRLFPELTVVPVGSCREVQKAVTGLRQIQERHDVEAFGLIDRDDRIQSDIEDLSRGYVFVLDVCAAEALYYCSASIIAVAGQQAKTHDDDREAMVQTALQKVFVVMQQEESSLAEEMAARLCGRQVRNSVLSKLPKWGKVFSERQPEIRVSIDYSPYFAELSRFKELIAERSWSNWDALVARYPLHKSSVFPEIVDVLKCHGKGCYEEVVRAQVKRDQTLMQHLKQRIGKLSEKLEQPPIDVTARSDRTE